VRRHPSYSIRRRVSRPLSSESEQRKKFRQVHEALGFLPFGRCECGTLILAVKQRLKSRLNTRGQSEAGEIVRDL
jgi:hypothetical protein